MARRKDPRYSDTPGYVCNQTENIWRVNPDPRAGWNRYGYIAFADDMPASQADKYFITVLDERDVQAFLRTIHDKTNKRLLSQSMVDNFVAQIGKIVHNPKHYDIDLNKKVFYIFDLLNFWLNDYWG